MQNSNLAVNIKNKALELGYHKCGIINIQDMVGYENKLKKRIEDYPADSPFLEKFLGFSHIKKTYPWAESIIILANYFGNYKVPKHLEGHIASLYLCNQLEIETSSDYQNNYRFGQYLKSLNIRAETDSKNSITALRWAAVQAGLGIFRKNNFFYTEKGSSSFLTLWLIDKKLELKEEAKLKPCPQECTKCVEACPTQSLKGPYSMQPTACVAFITGFGGDDLPNHPANKAMGNWIYGCDLCHLVCPFNKVTSSEKIECPGLSDFAEKISLTKIIDMDYSELENMFAKNFWYISKKRLWKWKVNALNAMKNSFKAEYLPWIQKACHDPIKEVQVMAKWVLENLKE